MRTLNTFSEEPKAVEVIVVDKTANVYIRENIESHTVEDFDGTERTEWTAVEYSARLVHTKDFAVTEDLIEQIKTAEYNKAAKEIRAMRDALLAESDKEVLPDRLNKNSNLFKAWSEYREALRDIPEQEGFPYDVEFPKKPE